MKIINKNELKISSSLFEFINNEAIPGTKIESEDFWAKFSKFVHELAPLNKDLIKKREIIQQKIDQWHKSNQGKEINKKEYLEFLKSISYLMEEKQDFNIETSNVDEEISSIAGPQLVVPVDNARYALNVANARWGSLYDTLYGTDVIKGKRYSEYNAERAKKVIEYVRNFLDESFPLSISSWKEITKIKIEDKRLLLLKDSKRIILKMKTNLLAIMEKKINLVQF